LIPELRVLLEGERVRVEVIERKTKRVVPWVFAQPDGRPAGDFKRAWATACIKAGFFTIEPVLDKAGTPMVDKAGQPVTVKKPTRLFHDFRRTAARRLVRAGIPEVTAMALLGHATNSIFKRYAIVDQTMRREAADKLAAYQKAEAGRLRQVRPRSRQVVALKA
jgi:integrase